MRDDCPGADAIFGELRRELKQLLARLRRCRRILPALVGDRDHELLLRTDDFLGGAGVQVLGVAQRTFSRNTVAVPFVRVYFDFSMMRTQIQVVPEPLDIKLLSKN
jgi:hypothetical protein